MNRKKLIKRMKHNHQINTKPEYIEKLEKYYNLFSDFNDIKYLINNIFISNRLLKRNQLPQDLPELLLPDNIQDIIFQKVNNKYAINDPKGDKLWNKYSNALPKLDKLIRSYRDYLEKQYGMWAYTSGPFVDDLSQFIGDQPVLEVMAGNGYISKGLRNNNKTVYSTDNLEWTNEKNNETGKHLVTKVEKLDALSAFKKYKDKIKYIIMSWSPDGVPVDWELLQAIRKSKQDITLITIGEKNGATNSKEFWKNAKYIDNDQAKHLNRHHQSFDLIHDKLYLIK